MLVENEKVHEMRKGGEASKSTEEYRAANAGFFVSPSESIDLEDGVFKDSLYKAMLAIGIGQDANILSAIRPVRQVGNWADRQDWLFVYWKQICAEIWNSHGGDWCSILALRKNGMVLLSSKDDTVEKYRETFADFFAKSKLSIESPTGDLVGVAFAPFFVDGKKSVIEIVNRNFDLVRDVEDRYVKLADAIRRSIPMLEPRGVHFSPQVRAILVAEIVNRINPAFTAETLAAFKKGES